MNEAGYVTEAERFGWSFVFAGLLPDDFPPTRAVAQAPWWRQVEGADWRHPEGPHSDVEGRAGHPVVHVSWDDARPTAPGPASACRPRRSGSTPRAAGWRGAVFPWGDELEPGGEHRMNVWQGAFPAGNTIADGFYGTAPVAASNPTATASGTRPGTCGNGARIGSAETRTQDGPRRLVPVP